MGFIDRLLGKPISSRHEEENKISELAAIPMLGLDALSSAAYGPEAALTLLLPLGAAGLWYAGPIIAVIVALLGILYLSYRQTMAAYPHGGGSYTVASENLGARAGLFAAAALLVDYILTAAVGISAGVGALVSAWPNLLPHMLPICLAILGLITLVNLRGTRSSGFTFALPTYIFIVSLLGVLFFGVFQTILAHGHPRAVERVPALPTAVAGVSLWLLAKAFASGCTAMTGVEAVSNGIGAFSKPGVKRAQRTLTAIVILLTAMLICIAYLCRAYHVGAVDPNSSQYQSVLSMITAAVVGRGVIYYITISSVICVLALSANTAFADFPRLCRLLAQDEYLPHSFADRGRRLVFTWGIAILALLTGVLLIAFGGITDRLIPLYAIGAFLAFTLSQAGMVQHWRRRHGKNLHIHTIVNGTGATATGIAIVVVLVAKFIAGAWITIILIFGLVSLFASVKRHYRRVERETASYAPIELSGIEPPIVVVPIGRWSVITAKAIKFSLTISPEVMAVHISSDAERLTDLKREWSQYVDQPCQAAGVSPPELSIVSSPYRRLFGPLLDHVRHIRKKHPSRTIAVVLPELVELKWYQYMLHTQRATWLKAAFLLTMDRQIVVINVPWYLGRG